MPHFLRKTHGSWSAGTRVEVLSSWTEPESIIDPGGSKDKEVELADVKIMAGHKPTLYGVLMNDLVERGKKS